MSNLVQMFFADLLAALLRLSSVFLIIFLATACADALKKEVQAIPRIEVYNADYQEEGVTPLDTGYQLYKVRLFNGKDTICIETNNAGKYFRPYARTYFLFINPDSVVRRGGAMDFLTENKVILPPFYQGIFYFEELQYNIQFDSIEFLFLYYHKSCDWDSIKGPIIAPMVPHLL